MEKEQIYICEKCENEAQIETTAADFYFIKFLVDCPKCGKYRIEHHDDGTTIIE